MTGTSGTGSQISTGSPRGLVVLPCEDLNAAIENYQAIGFQLEAIGPADEPTWAELSITGLRIQLDLSLTANSGIGDRSASHEAGPRLRITGVDEAPGQLPRYVEVATGTPTAIPDTIQALAIAHESAAGWISGRAGMLYRDLVPERHGGAYIASHIHIPEGGPVPDYVHHHDVAHQLIYCHRGWVRVVYQDQGPPFVMEPGDCVLQPPGIRHRVLEASDDLYVTEITCPAVHRTFIDNELELPTEVVDADQRFGGQKFVRHIGAETPWTQVAGTEFVEQVTAIETATDGLAAVRLVRAEAEQQQPWGLAHDTDFLFLFLLAGTGALIDPDGETTTLQEGSSVAVPAGSNFAMAQATAGTTVLELRSRRPEPAAS